MKKVLVLFTAAIMLAGFATFAWSAEKSMTGFLADANCAKDYEKASAEHAACAKSCVGRGAGWGLAMKDNHILLEIDAELADKHAGHKVTVKGEFDSEKNTLKVVSLEMTQ